MRDLDDHIGSAIQIGKSNQEVLRLVANWCSHIQIEPNRHFGIGVIEEIHGLPVSGRELHCPYAKAGARVAAMDLRVVALDFYDRNCHDCKQRKPVAIPNLMQLVQERDEADRKGREQASVEKQAADAALAKRKANRSARRSPLRPLKNALLDDIEAIDQGLDAEAINRLWDMATQTKDAYDEDVIESLFEVATPEALNLIAQVRPPSHRLTSALIVAEPTENAHLDYLASVLGELTEQEVIEALPLFAARSSESEHCFSRSVPSFSCIRAAYDRSPELVLEALFGIYYSGFDYKQHSAMSGLAAILSSNANINQEHAETLFSLGLNATNAKFESHANQLLLTEILKRWPKASAEFFKKSYAFGTPAQRELITRTLHMTLHRARHDSRITPSEVVEVAYDLLMQWSLADTMDFKSFDIQSFLRDDAGQYPLLLEKYFDRILGTLILLPQKIKTFEPRTILLPNEVQEDPFTRAASFMAMNSRLDAFVRLVGDGVAMLPEQAGRSLVRVIDSSLDVPIDEELLAQLIRALGKTSGALTIHKDVFPVLLSAMLGTSQLNQAAAIDAYGAFCELDAEAVPAELHDCFLLLMTDPYLCVWSACLRALAKGIYPFDPADIYFKVSNWSIALFQSHQSDDLLVRTLAQLHRTARSVNLDVSEFMLKALSECEPKAVDKFFDDNPGFIGKAGFTDIWFKLAKNPSLHATRYSLSREIGNMDQETITKHEQSIVELSHMLRDEELSRDLLLILLTNGNLAAAARMLADQESQVPQTTEYLPRRHFLQTLAKMCMLESALFEGNIESAENASLDLDRIEEERGADVRENFKRRSIGFGKFS